MTIAPPSQPRPIHRPADRAGIAGWLLFDFATQPFFTLVTTFVFAPFFASRVAETAAEGQALWGYATAAAGLAIALSAPFVGAVADVTGPRKPWIAAFGLMAAAGATALWWVEPGGTAAVPLALAAFAVATIGIEYATVFNNAMMPSLVPPERLGRLSGTGWALGYVGGLVSLVLTLGFLAADPADGRTLIGLVPLFGLDPGAHEGDRVSGPLSAIWFVVFVMPLFLFTPDAGGAGTPLARALPAAGRRLRATLREARSAGPVARFLLANMLYTDGLVALFAFGGVYAAGVFGWTTVEIGLFGILLTVTGTAGALAGGWLDDRVGSRPVVLGALVLLALSAAAIVSLAPDRVFFILPATPATPGDGLYASAPEQVFLALGALIGLAAGPVQASSRALLCRLAPADRMAEYFGLFALTGKITSFLGPLLVALATDWTDSQRAGVLPLVVLFVAGAVLLAGVRVRRG